MCRPLHPCSLALELRVPLQILSTRPSTPCRLLSNQVFKEEEALHVLEGVPWKEVEYQDNSACIELLEKPPNGIFRLLDSQCKAPNASEESLCKEVNQLHAKGGFLAPTRVQRMRDEEGFIVRHYAGDVALSLIHI